MKIHHTKNKIHLTFYVDEVSDYREKLKRSDFEEFDQQEDVEKFFNELTKELKKLYYELEQKIRERERHDSASAD